MKKHPCSILRKNVNTPRRTPYAFQNAAKSKLDYLVELGVLEVVKNESDWCSEMSFLPKPDGVFDAKNGYWQIPLDEESKPLTTFITEWGCYRYLRAPMGLTSSGDKFCARTDKALAGIPGVFPLVDDVLMFGDSVE